MIDTSAYKTAIIDLAVTGQLSTEFHADDSVEEITTALPQLSNKRRKLLGQSFEYGKQASLPNHWKWIRLGEISSYGDTPTKALFDDVSGDTWILDLEDIKSGGQIQKKTRVHGKKFIGDKTVFREGQVLYSKLRPYLKKVLVADEDGISTPELISFDTYGGVIPQYVVYCLLSSFTDRAIEKRSYGIKMPRIDAAFMVNLPVPLPPVSEQQFIVDRVQKAFSQIDTIDELQLQYTDNLTVLKSKLIDGAIQGKLTEQLPEDGTAEELYHQIQAEKKALIKTGKIKKEKPLHEITDDEVPFSIPSNWKWVRFSDLYSLSNGTASRGTQGGKPYPVLRLADLTSGHISTGSIRNIDLSCDEFENHKVRAGDLIFIRVNGSRDKVANAFLYTGEEDISYCDHLFCGHKTSSLFDASYIMMVYQSNMAKAQIDPEIKTTAGQNTINQKSMAKIVIPLPPLAEQRRIVQKINELMPLFEKCPQ